MNKLEVIATGVFLKVPFIQGLIATIGAFLASFFLPLVGFMVFILLAILIDFYTGKKAAIARGEKSNSKAMRESIPKATSYFLIIVMAELFRLVFFVWTVPPAMLNITQYVPVTYIVAFLIARIELKSLAENVEDITGTPIWQAIKDRLPFKTKSEDLNE